MIVDIKVPELGESIQEVELGEWAISLGEFIEADEPIVDVESEKASVELPAPSGGVLVEILVQTGEVAAVGDVVGRLDTSGVKPDTTKAAKGPVAPEKRTDDVKVMPAARRVMAQNDIDEKGVLASGPGNRVLKEDAVAAANNASPEPAPEPAPTTATPEPDPDPRRVEPSEPPAPAASGGKREETRKRMTPLRRTIAKRLVQSKQEMAILTTFNEVDMSAVKQLRSMLGEAFLQRNGVKLGFMSFFIRATQYALQEFPLVNAMIDGNEIVYRNYVDVGVAIGGGKGLVVPVIRDVEHMSLARIEKAIVDFAGKAKSNSLAPEELEGGTFTISNGGVYGSMLSTPIVNPPQSAILGLHAIKDRAMVVDKEIVVRPMMYLALSYDHRLVDGREAVSFLKAIKESIEKPAGMILEING